MLKTTLKSIALTLGFLAIALGSLTAKADHPVQPDPHIQWVTWDGWGCSLCWWAKEFGDRDDIADLFFTMNETSLNGTTLPGLGMTGVRYNAGACSWNEINGESMVESPSIEAHRQMEGFWLNWFDSDPNSASWDWTVDVNQRAMLAKARDRGATHFELFSNSPMWWMCYNHNPSGANNGSTDNLQSWNQGNHAVYLATVAKYFADNFGINFNSVAAFNEPSAAWWHAGNNQEGCHFGKATQATVLNALRSELDQRSMQDVVVSSSDESYFSQALDTFNSFDAATDSTFSQVNVHGYQYGNGPRNILFFNLAGKKLWLSEYGESNGDGMEMAKNLNLDFKWLHPDMWMYWQPLDGSNWGLINADLATGTIGSVTNKYYIMAQYSRHIRPGMVILNGGETDTVAAYDAKSRKLVLISRNAGAGDTYRYDLSKFGPAAGPVTRWQTNTDGSIQYQTFNDTTIDGNVCEVWFPQNSIQTIEIENVDLIPRMNVALNKPTTVDSELGDANTGQMAVDGVPNRNDSRWISADTSFPHWIEIDLEEEHRLDEVRFWTGLDEFNDPIQDFQFQRWDGSQWVDIFSESGNTDSSFAKTFPPINATKIRLFATGGSDNYIRLFELQAFGAPATQVPNNYEVINGVQLGGDIESLGESDNTDVRIRRNQTQILSVVEMIATATSRIQYPTSLTFTVESSVFARREVTQTVSLFNYQSNEFEVVDSRPAARFSDSIVSVTPTGDPIRFVEPATGTIQARIKYQSGINRTSFSAGIDWVQWRFE